ncbi:MAG: hypothetical protein MJ182_03755 [Treponema sp.]|nr:hypothetical protein [Treponema sp.]
MKKVLVLAALVSVICGSAFADKVKVSSVEGKVTVLSGNEWVSVSEGMTLDTEDAINTGLNASVVFDNGVSIKPMRKGKISELTTRSSSQATLVLGSSLTKESMKNLAAVAKDSSTSGRASEAKEDLDWDE